MKGKRQEMRVFQTDLLCDNCNTVMVFHCRYVEYNGALIVYVHMCHECKNREYAATKFPIIEYKPLENKD